MGGETITASKCENPAGVPYSGRTRHETQIVREKLLKMKIFWVIRLLTDGKIGAILSRLQAGCHVNFVACPCRKITVSIKIELAVYLCIKVGFKYDYVTQL